MRNANPSVRRSGRSPTAGDVRAEPFIPYTTFSSFTIGSNRPSWRPGTRNTVSPSSGPIRSRPISIAIIAITRREPRSILARWNPARTTAWKWRSAFVRRSTNVLPSLVASACTNGRWSIAETRKERSATQNNYPSASGRKQLTRLYGVNQSPAATPTRSASSANKQNPSTGSNHAKTPA